MAVVHNKQIWSGLVDYANELDLESDEEALKEFAKTLSDSLPWMARTAFALFGTDVPEMIATLTNRDVLFAGVNGKCLWPCIKSEEQLANEFRQQAIEYQPQVRQLLTQLSDRKRNAQDRLALAFLHEHTQHIEFQRGDPALAPEVEAHRYFTPSGELKDHFPYRTLLYKDLADVICDFIQREHEARRGVPIQICKRPGCGNLVAQFKKRQYCGTDSCDRERQKRDNDLKQQKNRDNVFLYRLRKLQPAPRRKRARESVDRLRQIENDWRDKNKSLATHASRLLDEVRQFP